MPKILEWKMQSKGKEEMEGPGRENQMSKEPKPAVPEAGGQLLETGV